MGVLLSLQQGTPLSGWEIVSKLHWQHWLSWLVCDINVKKNCQPSKGKGFVPRFCSDPASCSSFCENDGICEIDLKKGAQCNCTGTYYIGDQCQCTYVRVLFFLFPSWTSFLSLAYCVIWLKRTNLKWKDEKIFKFLLCWLHWPSRNRPVLLLCVLFCFQTKISAWPRTVVMGSA